MMQTENMICRFIFTGILLGSIIVSAEQQVVDKLWVIMDDTQIKSERTSASKTIATLSRGTEVFVRNYEKRWYFIFTADGFNGWIYRGKLSKFPPDDTFSAEEVLQSRFEIENDPNYSEDEMLFTARSIRGTPPKEYISHTHITPVAKKYSQLAQTPSPHLSALEKIYSFEAHEKEIIDFMTKEKIGEYE